MSDIIKSRHPDYVNAIKDWQKYRCTYNSDETFRDLYLRQLSEREDYNDFCARKSLTYVPAFAEGNINEVKNAIIKRFGDIKRNCKCASFETASKGENFGVDGSYMTMNSFMGDNVLVELLVQGKVGVYVDMPEIKGNTAKDQESAVPYVYIYRAENILNWQYIGRTQVLQSLLLFRWYTNYDAATGLATNRQKEYLHYRLARVEDKTIVVLTKYDEAGEPTAKIDLQIDEIPFVMDSLPKSLMARIADYQIALMQLTSSDLMYLIKANFPFYVEQVNQAFQSPHLNLAGRTADGQNPESNTSAAATPERSNEIKVGATRGRRYPIGADAPQFIAPPEGPIKISMEKQGQIKDEMRALVHLTLSNFMPKMQSEESKKMDNLPLESGLSFIGSVLNRIEKRVYRIWSKYEGIKDDTPELIYPKNYSMLTQGQIDAEITAIRKDIDTAPSLKMRRELAKRIVWLRFNQSLPESEIAEIYKEIDEATVITGDPNVLYNDVRELVIDAEDAAKGRCYPADTAEKAEKKAIVKMEASAKRGGGSKAGRTEPPKKGGTPDV